MKREAFFDRDASHYYCEDGKAVGAYCREHFPEDAAQTLAVGCGAWYIGIRTENWRE